MELGLLQAEKRGEAVDIKEKWVRQRGGNAEDALGKADRGTWTLLGCCRAAARDTREAGVAQLVFSQNVQWALDAR